MTFPMYTFSGKIRVPENKYWIECWKCHRKIFELKFKNDKCYCPYCKAEIKPE